MQKEGVDNDWSDLEARIVSSVQLRTGNEVLATHILPQIQHAVADLSPQILQPQRLSVAHAI